MQTTKKASKRFKHIYSIVIHNKNLFHSLFLLYVCVLAYVFSVCVCVLEKQRDSKRERGGWKCVQYTSDITGI